MNQYKLTVEQKIKIVQLKKQGITPKYIAERFDITTATVSHIVRKARAEEKGV